MKELAEEPTDAGSRTSSSASVVSHSEREICKCCVCYSTDSLRRPSWVIDIHMKEKTSVGRPVHSRDKETKELRELKRQ